MSQSPKPLMSIVETALFLRQADRVWGEDDRRAFVDFIAANPEAGDMIPDAYGVRKVRWGRPGTGKRGGVRVIYFYHDPNMPLYLLMMYAKAERENWTQDEKRRVRSLVAGIKQMHGRA